MSDLVTEFGSGDGAVYMLTGNKHAAMMVVSLMTLRRHYDGPVAIIWGDEAADRVACEIDIEKRLAPVLRVGWKAPTGGGKGLQHANKCRLFDLSPFERTVFLDADTTVHGPINELLPRVGTEEVRLTQFCDWVTTGRKINSRIQQYKDILPGEVAAMTAHAYPAVNTGTFGFSNLSGGYFAELMRVCKAKPVFMADELAAQLIFPKYPHVVLDDRYNWSPVYSHSQQANARIIHYHGSAHCRPDKGIGCSIWPPLFREAWDQNLAGIREWAPAGDRHLRRWMEKEGIGP